MRRGQLCVVVPVSAVAAIALPALAGVLFLGERPSAQVYIGIVAAATALWLVSCGDRLRAALQTGGALEGAIAGVGFALQSTAVFMPGDAAGYWPLAANRLAAMCTVAILARSLHLPLSWRSALARPALALGAAAVVSLALYLHAARLGLMSTAVAISSLYPVVPALLGVYVLRERLAPLQVAGLAMAALAVALIAMG
ncbi:EamA family transporter [Bordetella petrii]|nr:EamA family transporter [Bordetella petrii]